MAADNSVAQHTKNSMMRALLDNQIVGPGKMFTPLSTLVDPRANRGYDPYTNVMDTICTRRTMTIQVTPIENGYVVAITADAPGMVPRLFYATDLNDVGQQITAFGVTQELEGKGANT